MTEEIREHVRKSLMDALLKLVQSSDINYNEKRFQQLLDVIIETIQKLEEEGIEIRPKNLCTCYDCMRKTT